jgi:tetratricopeptide (TPR) repeat protein
VDFHVVNVREESYNRVVYAAIETLEGEEKGNVFAVVALMDVRAGQWSIKWMSENDEPYAHGCPNRILDKLTVSNNAHALSWRETCRNANSDGAKGKIMANDELGDGNGAFNKAIADFTRVIEINPKDSIAYKYRGDAYVRAKEYDKAIADYTQAIKINPYDADVHFDRGLAYTYLFECNKALADLNQAIEIDPSITDRRRQAKSA